jgi:hypothetical protein
MAEEKSWKEFRDSKLLWWVNRSLHLFGWAIILEFENDEVVRAYPAKCKFRGFDEKTEQDGFKGQTRHDGENRPYLKVGNKQNLVIATVTDPISVIKLWVEARDARLNDKIEGLSLLKNAISEHNQYATNFEKAMSNEMQDGANMPKSPELSIDDLATKYPVAACYVKAEGYSRAANFSKSAAGKKAMKLLLDGGSVNDAEEILNSWLDDTYID